MFRNVVSGLVRQRVAFNGIQRRTFAGGHAVKKDWTGIDKTVRDVFPEDHQLAMAILGGYASLIVLYKIKSAISGGGKKEAIEAK